MQEREKKVTYQEPCMDVLVLDEIPCTIGSSPAGDGTDTNWPLSLDGGEV